MSFRAAIILLLLLPLMAHGQRGRRREAPGEAHISVSSSAEGMTATELLSRKLSEAELPDYLKQLLGKGNNIDADSAQKLLNSPLGASILKRLAEGDPAVMKLAEQIAAGRPELKGMSSEKIRQLLSDRANSLVDPGRLNPELTNLTTPAPSATERERLARAAYAERLTDMLHDLKMDGMLEQLREVPAFQNWMNELGKAGNQSAGPLTLGDTMRWFGGLDELSKKLRVYLPKDLPSLSQLSGVTRSPPTVNVPSFDFSHWFPSLQFDGGNWPTYAIGIAAVAIAGAALMRMRKTAHQSAPSMMRLGPWPVKPNHVSTRKELIAAFEYLALLKCGADAAHWHHRAVAGDLGREPSARTDAEFLAATYEQARYVPMTGDQPNLWASARPALCRLAGVQA